jgi:hypothetical protein
VDIAEDEMPGFGNAVGMSPDFALKHEDFPAGQALAQMVEGAAVAKAKLEHRPRQGADRLRRQVEAGPLGFQTSNETV